MNNIKRHLSALVILSSLAIVPITVDSASAEIPTLQEKNSEEIAYRGHNQGHRGNHGRYYGGSYGVRYGPSYGYRSYYSPRYYNRGYSYPYSNRYYPYYYNSYPYYRSGGSGVTLYFGW